MRIQRNNGFTLIATGSRCGVTLSDKGFTLIELLVVIAIIALLLSIIAPSLRLAKAKASAVVDMTNVKNISLAWTMYNEDNNSDVPSSEPRNAAGWIRHPIDAAGVDCSFNSTTPIVTDDDERRGLEKGVLFGYLKSSDVFHCPFDRRKSIYDGSNVLRTYAMPRALAINTDKSHADYNKQIHKSSEIKSPGSKIMLVEEAEERNFNYGSWDFGAPEWTGSTTLQWNDPLGVTHGDSSTLGFCDGHTEIHKWVDEETKMRTHWLADHPGQQYYGLYTPTAKTDIEYIYSLWAYRVK